MSVSGPDRFAIFAVMDVNGFEAVTILLIALIALGPEAARKTGDFINQD